MKAIVFDTETTGLLLPAIAPLEKQPKIIELGVLLVDDGEPIVEWSQLVHPGEDITPEITKITGITNEDLVGQPSFKDVLPTLSETFAKADTLICHNAPFDVGMLTNELRRCGAVDSFPMPRPENIICTVAEYTPTFGRRPRLIDLYKHVMGEELAQSHRALDDAKKLNAVLVRDGFYKKVS